MSFLDKVMFWKKKDTLDFGGGFGSTDLGNSSLGGSMGTGGMGDFGTESGLAQQGFSQQPSGYGTGFAPRNDFGNQQYQFQQQPASPFAQQPNPGMNNNAGMTQQQANVNSKDLEIVSSKLDALRAILDSINQRLANLERISSGEYETKRRNW